MSCSFLNLAECITNGFQDWFLFNIAAPVIPLLSAVRYLLTTPPSIAVFGSLWGVIMHLISLFYGLFIMSAGLNFIISGYNPEKRTQAKEWLENIVLMIIFVQASYLIYSLIVEISTGITAGIVGLIDSNFFSLTFNNTVNVSLELMFGATYVIILIITVLLLGINYLFASIGVLFVPIGIFLYFIPPLRDIGKMILNTLGFIIFLPFFVGLILLGSSELVRIENYEFVKFIILVSSFFLCDIMIVLMAIAGVFRGITSLLQTNAARGVMFLKGHFLAATASGKDQSPRVERDYHPPNYHSSRQYYDQRHER